MAGSSEEPIIATLRAPVDYAGGNGAARGQVMVSLTSWTEPAAARRDTITCPLPCGSRLLQHLRQQPALRRAGGAGAPGDDDLTAGMVGLDRADGDGGGF